MKISPKKQLAMSCVALVLSAKAVSAKEIVEVDRKFVWKPVPGTQYLSELLENLQSDSDLHYINTNNVVRRRNLVVFEIVTPDATYLRIEGNCQTEQVRELYWGSFQSENSLVYDDVDYPWREVNYLDKKLLRFACNIK